MSNQYGPRIVTNGLVLCLDAGNSKSYPGSGTVWNDLSGNGNNGTLVNGPAYSSLNKGSIVFDGVNDHASCGSSALLQSNPMTFSMWVQRTNTWGNGSCLFWAKPNGNFQGNGFYIEPASPGLSNRTTIVFNSWPNYVQIPTDGNTTFPLNTPINFCFTISGSSVVVYINGSSTSILTTGTPNITSTNDTKYIMSNSPTYNNFTPGIVHSINIYNIALSATQVLQNYNATKGRFNL